MTRRRCSIPPWFPHTAAVEPYASALTPAEIINAGIRLILGGLAGIADA